MDQKMAGSALSQLLAPRKGQEHAVEIKGKNNQIMHPAAFNDSSTIHC